jgi:hypothetical protein
MVLKALTQFQIYCKGKPSALVLKVHYCLTTGIRSEGLAYIKYTYTLR